MMMVHSSSSNDVHFNFNLNSALRSAPRLNNALLVPLQIWSNLSTTTAEMPVDTVLHMPQSFGFWSIIVLLFCFILVVFTVVGNICVIVAVHQSKALQAPQNKLIVSLAYADLLVGLVVMPFAAIADFVGFWILGAIPCDIWNVLDVCLCTSSILHLVAIALDRYFSITNMRYIQNRRSLNMMYAALALIWGLSMVLAVGPVMGWRDADYAARIARGICLVSQNLSFQIFGTTFAFYLPLTGILILYGLIFQRTRSRVRKRMETTLASTLHEIHRIEKDANSTYPSVPNSPSTPSTPTQHITTTFHNGSWRTKLRFPRGSPRKRYDSPRKTRMGSFGGSTHDLPRSGSASHMAHSEEDLPAVTLALNRKASNGTTLTGNSGGSVKSLNSSKKTASLSVKHQTLLRREKKAATTLAIITLSFVACWLPFFIYAIVRPVCGEECLLPPLVESTFLWLGYVNSTLNPIIYTIFSPDFRTAFKKMFRLEKR